MAPHAPSAPVLLRRAVPGDAAGIAVLWRAAWHASHAPLSPPGVAANRTPAWFATRAVDLVSRACVAGRAGALVGFAAWTQGELGQLFVAVEEYGSGTAAALLAHAEAALVQQGTATAVLACRMGNGRAVGFYEKHGWRRDGTFTQELKGTDGPHGVLTWRMVKRLEPEWGPG